MDEELMNTEQETSDTDLTNKIVVKQAYFDNIKSAVDSLNEFFSSKFTKKNFPMLEEDFTVDGTITQLVQYLNSVDASWVSDSSHLDSAVDKLNEVGETLNDGGLEELLNRNDKSTLDLYYTFLGYKVLLFIADHFDEFQELMNGIYSMDIFTKTSQYRAVIELFSKNINIDEIKTYYPDAEDSIFSITKYLNNLYADTEQITFPESMTKEDQEKRMYEFEDLSDEYEIVIDDAVQEAAEVNYFQDTKPEHIKYNTKAKKFQISKQFQKEVDKLIDALKNCDTTEDLLKVFGGTTLDASKFANVVSPFILTKAFTNPKKYHQTAKVKSFKSYTDSYESIINKNNGAKRFQNYDIFSTFKTDKDGTISFLKSFLTLDLVNDKNAVISNNTLLTIFNIFDSRIYLDILFNMIPDETKQAEKLDEDSWVKKIRTGINANSRKKNVYQDTDNASETAPKTDEVQEQCLRALKAFGDMSITDMIHCESFHTLIHDEIGTMDDELFRQGISALELDSFIGESYNIFTEQEDGQIPDYMKTRINMSDDDKLGNTKVEPVDDPTPNIDTDNEPSLDDLTDSLDAKLSTPGDLEETLGTGYEKNPNKKDDGRIVYNITNHYSYTNSFNHDSNNNSSRTTTTNDLSSGKTIKNDISGSYNDSSTGKHVTKKIDNSSVRYDGSDVPTPKKSKSSDDDETRQVNIQLQFDPSDADNDQNTASETNSYNNSNESLDTVDDESNNKEELSNGMTLQEMFAILEAAEPLSGDNVAKPKPPKGDLLTAALDNDRKTLAKQQEGKKGVQKLLNTGKAVLKPVTRAKQWLLKITDSLIKRDENQVKQELTENPSYRSALYKASRVALKIGAFAVLTTISGYLGAAFAGIQLLKIADRNRMKEEAEQEIMTEIGICDEKIQYYQEKGYSDPAAMKKKYEYMRHKGKLQKMAANIRRSTFRHPKTIA